MADVTNEQLGSMVERSMDQHAAEQENLLLFQRTVVALKRQVADLEGRLAAVEAILSQTKLGNYKLDSLGSKGE